MDAVKELEAAISDLYGLGGTDTAEEAPAEASQPEQPRESPEQSPEQSPEESPEQAPQGEGAAEPEEPGTAPAAEVSGEEPEPLTLPETIRIGDQDVPYREVVEAYNLWRDHSEMLRSSAALLREIDSRISDPLWAEAFKVLMSDNWREAVSSGEEEEEGFDFFESSGEQSQAPPSEPRPEPRPGPSELAYQAALLEMQYRQGEADFERYAKELEAKYGAMTPQDWARIADIAEKYAILTPDGWWEPKHGNPFEIAARLDPSFASRLQTSREQAKKRQAVDDASSVGSPTDQTPGAGRRDRIAELEQQIREAYRI